MKIKILWIAYLYPPDETIGAVRPVCMQKYLHKLGIESHTLTHEVPFPVEGESGVTRVAKLLFRNGVLKTKSGEMTSGKFALQRNLRQMLRIWIKSFIYVPDRDVYWFPLAYSAGVEVCRLKRIRAIISTSPPASAHLIGAALKRRTGLPWIADLRDLWSLNPLYYYGRLRQKLDTVLEKLTLSRADTLVTVSHPMAEQLLSRYSDKKVVCIPNGFDPAGPEFHHSFAAPRDSVFKILYTGRLYEGRRDPEPLFTAVKELASNGIIRPGDFRLEFYGPDVSYLRKATSFHGLKDFVTIHGNLPRSEALRAQKNASALLLISNYDQGTMTAKVYEYVAAGRPILAIVRPGSVLRSFIENSRTGVAAASHQEIVNILRAWISETRIRGDVTYAPDMDVIQSYGYPKLATEYAGLIDSVIDGVPPWTG